MTEKTKMSFVLTQTDAEEWLGSLPSESVDLIITDPPYESLEKHRAVGTTTRLKHSKASSNDWFDIFPNRRFPALFEQLYRVLKPNRHFYLYCDQETMFVAKPVGEQVGFRFWKPLVWDKCLGPATLVWTDRGVRRIEDLVVGDRVALPEGGTTPVRATRRTRAEAVRIELSDGTELVASTTHRLMRADGAIVEARALREGDGLLTRAVRERTAKAIQMDDVIPEADAVCELPSVTACLWCGEQFESARAAAAHQARWCKHANSKRNMAEQLGIAPKRLRRWMDRGRLPRAWAEALGLSHKLGPRIQCYQQNDLEVWYPTELALDHELGKVIGLYAAEGSRAPTGVTFALHANEKHLHATIARFVRFLGARCRLSIEGNRALVAVYAKVMRHLVDHFIGGDDARTKFFKPIVYAAPAEFRRGVLDGLLEGDGHWSHEKQRETYVSASPDLAMFVRRELAAMDRRPTVGRLENEHAGAWRVRFDPIQRYAPTTVTGIEELGEQELVDISIADRDELFLLANGVVTHNCKIGMGYHYRSRYELVLFFEKGKRKLADLGVADIIEEPRVYRGYPAEKPVRVSEVLIAQSSAPGELVIDPFTGSGSVGAAALGSGRNFWGNDKCKEAVEVARARLAELGREETELVGPPQLEIGFGSPGRKR